MGGFDRVVMNEAAYDRERLTQWLGGRGGWRRLRGVSGRACVECAGKGRSFFATQQNTPAPGTQWGRGGGGVGRWRGVRLGSVLRGAGVTAGAVDVLPQGLDAEFVSNGV